MLLLAMVPARAEFDALRTLAEQEHFDVTDVLSGLLRGELPDIGAATEKWARALVEGLRSEMTDLIGRMIAPVTAFAALKLALGDRPRALSALGLICALCCGLALMTQYRAAQAQARQMLERMARASSALAPAQVAVAALTGAPNASAAMLPLSSTCVNLLEKMLGDVGLRLSSAAAVAAVAGNLSPRFTLDRLFALIRGGVRWLLGGAMCLFGGMLALQGMFSGAGDTAAARAAKVALENLVPIVGGQLSGSAGMLAVSAGMARRAVGVTGVMLMAHMCARPLIRLAAGTLAVKLAAAAVEPLAEGPVAAMAASFGDNMEMLLAICACGAVMTAMLAGGCAMLLTG